MGRGNGDDDVRLAEVGVDLLKAFKKSRYRTRADGKVAAHFDIARAQLSGNDPNSLLRLRVYDEKQVFRQQLAEPAMDLTEALRSECSTSHAAFINPLLNGDMRPGLELQVALAGILAVVLLKGALDVHRVGIVTLDEVGVVTVHRPHQVGEGREQAGRQAAPETSRLLGQFDGEIGQPAPVTGAFADEQRLHQRDRFAPVFCHLNVRFHSLIQLYFNILYYQVFEV